jgi:hypothetical protein
MASGCCAPAAAGTPAVDEKDMGGYLMVFFTDETLTSSWPQAPMAIHSPPSTADIL